MTKQKRYVERIKCVITLDVIKLNVNSCERETSPFCSFFKNSLQIYKNLKQGEKQKRGV